MVKEVVEAIVNKKIAKEYPHIQYPMAMQAKVTSKAVIDDEWFRYSIKVLTESGAANAAFPEVPNVYSKLDIDTGKRVAVILLYGELNPYIVGEMR